MAVFLEMLDADCSLGPKFIGEIAGGAGAVLLGEDGKPYHIDNQGWDHFQKGG